MTILVLFYKNIFSIFHFSMFNSGIMWNAVPQAFKVYTCLQMLRPQVNSGDSICLHADM